MQNAKSADFFFQSHPQWQIKLDKLRTILLNAGLQEAIKWGSPTYSLNNKNLVAIGAFKSYVGLWFFQGALLKDEAGVLINAQDGKTKAMRQWRFASNSDLPEALINQYIQQTIENHRAGKEIKAQNNKALIMPTELLNQLQSDPQLAGQFEQLSKSKQREYADYISSAKRQTTKQSRLQKIAPMIIQGVGLNDKYR